MSDDDNSVWPALVMMVLIAVSLFACKPGLNDKQRDQVRDIAADVAAEDQSAAIAELQSRVEELESRLDY